MANNTTFIIGASGKGKTNFALTFPGPRVLFDLDCKGYDSLPDRLEGTDIIQFPDSVSVEALLMHKRQEKVTSTTAPHAYRDFVGRVNATILEQVAVLKAAPKEAFEVNAAGQAIPKDFEVIVKTAEGMGKKFYRTVVVDSWSMLCLAANREVHYVQDTLGLPTTLEDYGMLDAKYRDMLPKLVGFPCEHLILTAHEDPTRDELFKQITFTPYTVGQSIRPIIPTYFSNVFRARTVLNGGELSYVCDTRSVPYFDMGKTKWHALPLTCPQDWRWMEQRMKEAQKGGGQAG